MFRKSRSRSYSRSSSRYNRDKYSFKSNRENIEQIEKTFFSKEIEPYDPLKAGFKDGRGIKYHDEGLERATK